MKKNIRRVLKGLLLCFVLGVVASVLINAEMISSQKERIFDYQSMEELTKNAYDCIIVLGAGIKEDNTVSNMLRERLDCSVKAYDMGISQKLLMSGDHGRKDYDEVNVMKKYAINLGVPSGDIFMDHAGFSTYETMYRAKEIFEVERAVVITQGYHMYRALYVAEKLGIEAVGIDAKLHEYPGAAIRIVREYAARCKDFLYLIIKPKPTFLGEVIPVSGNGNTTND